MVARLQINDFEELIQKSEFPYLMYSHQKSRKEQNNALIDKIIKRSIALLPINSNLIEDNSFFVGAVDMMVSLDKTGNKQFHILEINGGSTRGFWSLTENQIEQIYLAYLETLKYAENPSPFIVIGHLDNDSLLYEKLLLVNRLITFGNVPSENIILQPYSTLIPKLTFDYKHVFYQDKIVDIIIGDGITRRINGFFPNPSLKTIIVNKIHPITDSKLKTYQILKNYTNELKQFSVNTLKFWKADNQTKLTEILKSNLKDYKTLVIKPSNSSGGCGIEFINDKNEIERKIKNSLRTVNRKFGKSISPYPYLITEKIKVVNKNFLGSNRVFDIKIHVARKGNKIFAVGGKFRLSEPDALITNLTSDGGLAAHRALGINRHNLKKLNLTIDDMAKCFAASMFIISQINKHLTDMAIMPNLE